MRHGTWTETGGGGIPVGQIIIGAVVAGVAWGIFEAVSAFVDGALTIVLWAFTVLAVALVAGAVWATVYRWRHHEFPWAGLQRRMVGQPQFHELGGDRPEVGQRMPRELHQHVHLHLAPGADPADAAEIIRRSQWPE